VDDLDRIERFVSDLQSESDPLIAAAIATSRIARSQAFSEGNKRTALLVGRWILEQNGLSGSRIIPKDDHELANLLLRAARGEEISEQVVAIFKSRFHRL
jgi:prophage maintenance system killer protein